MTAQFNAQPSNMMPPANGLLSYLPPRPPMAQPAMGQSSMTQPGMGQPAMTGQPMMPMQARPVPSIAPAGMPEVQPGQLGTAMNALRARLRM